MKRALLGVVLAGAVALSACETTGYGGGYGGGQTRLSQCGRNALIGAAVGAVVGAAQDSSDNRAENAAMGAAVGGLATYGVCRWLTARERQRVESAYYQSLNSNQPVQQSWEGERGDPRSLTVQQPSAAPGRGNECRRVQGSVSDGQSSQALPEETFCRNASGEWVPA